MVRPHPRGPPRRRNIVGGDRTAGVVYLTILAITLPDPLVRVDGLRSVLSLIVNTAAMIVFLASSQIAWVAAGLMAGSGLGLITASDLFVH
ncbi:MAG: hypothetical protein ACRDYZ_13195 [Acidimicrobiales bacterium]